MKMVGQASSLANWRLGKLESSNVWLMPEAPSLTTHKKQQWWQAGYVIWQIPMIAGVTIDVGDRFLSAVGLLRLDEVLSLLRYCLAVVFVK
jgi:hypothetical protein